jgi:hypothetical protein
MCLRAPYGENWKSGSRTKKLSARRLRESEAAGKSARAPFTSLASNKEPRTKNQERRTKNRLENLFHFLLPQFIGCALRTSSVLKSIMRA